MFLDEYKRSLKMSEAEEMVDLLFYRPLAYGFVRLICRLPITPNQVTFFSMVCGLIAAHEFSVGNAISLFWAGLWYAVANILDCADGQLARLQQSGTVFGRLVDGIADYISSIAIFVGIGIGLNLAGQSSWMLVILAMLSSAFQAMLFDYYQGEYISSVRGERNFIDREFERFDSELQRAKQKEQPLGVAILSIYLKYVGIQKGAGTKRPMLNVSPEQYKRRNSLSIRFWSLLGPSTNRTLLIVCGLLNRIDLYLWVVCIGGNVWLVGMYFVQRNIESKFGDTVV